MIIGVETEGETEAEADSDIVVLNTGGHVKDGGVDDGFKLDTPGLVAVPGSVVALLHVVDDEL